MTSIQRFSEVLGINNKIWNNFKTTASHNYTWGSFQNFLSSNKNLCLISSQKGNYINSKFKQQIYKFSVRSDHTINSKIIFNSFTTGTRVGSDFSSTAVSTPTLFGGSYLNPSENFNIEDTTTMENLEDCSKQFNNSIFTIDSWFENCPGAVACFMLKQIDPVTKEPILAFIENSTARCVPRLLKKIHDQNLEPRHVKYIIVTHVHLDHAGGTSALSRMCPNATIIVHPLGAPHLIDPAALIRGVQSVYGEELFDELYPDITPIRKERVKAVKDGETIEFGKSELLFRHTAGHAKHHMIIYDEASKSAFTGDTFGINYLPYLRLFHKYPLFPETDSGIYSKDLTFCSSSPIDFDPDSALKSIDLILSLGADRIFTTHFGCLDDIQDAADQLRKCISLYAEFVEDTILKIKENETNENIQSWLETKVKNSMIQAMEDNNIDSKRVDWYMFRYDINLNAMGIIVAAKRKMKNAKEKS